MIFSKNTIKFNNGYITPVNHDGFLKWDVIHKSVDGSYTADTLELALDEYDKLEAKYSG